MWHAGAVWSKNESTLNGTLEARKWYDEALRRDPSLVRAMTGRERTLRYESDVSDAMYVRCQASLALGRYDDAIAACERAVGLYVWWTHDLYLIAAYALKGNLAKATAEKQRLLNLRPGASIADFKSLRWSDEPAYLQQIEDHLFAGLRKAGIREQ